MWFHSVRPCLCTVSLSFECPSFSRFVSSEFELNLEFTQREQTLRCIWGEDNCKSSNSHCSETQKKTIEDFVSSRVHFLVFNIQCSNSFSTVVLIFLMFMWMCVRVRDAWKEKRKREKLRQNRMKHLIVSCRRLIIIYAVRYKSLNMRINWQTNRMYDVACVYLHLQLCIYTACMVCCECQWWCG